jgi:hypothetical protein
MEALTFQNGGALHFTKAAKADGEDLDLKKEGDCIYLAT